MNGKKQAGETNLNELCNRKYRENRISAKTKIMKPY